MRGTASTSEVVRGPRASSSLFPRGSLPVPGGVRTSPGHERAADGRPASSRTASRNELADDGGSASSDPTTHGHVVVGWAPEDARRGASPGSRTLEEPRAPAAHVSQAPQTQAGRRGHHPLPPRIQTLGPRGGIPGRQRHPRGVPRESGGPKRGPREAARGSGERKQGRGAGQGGSHVRWAALTCY